MGGGTPILEANRVGCTVIGYDINPMAYWIVREEIDYLDLNAYRQEADLVQKQLDKELGTLYSTTCLLCGSPNAAAKYFLWVKQRTCGKCRKDFDLFPGYLIAENKRHTANVILCAQCGSLNERPNIEALGECSACGLPLTIPGPAKANRCPCPHCGAPNSYPNHADGPPKHRLFAIEYYCVKCKSEHSGRFFKSPDSADLARIREAEDRRARTSSRFTPDDAIPQGDETNRLHRWGYNQYTEMFNARQLHGLDLICRIVDRVSDRRVRYALATNVSDLLRYQNMLCRYDTRALKSLDIFSVHGFPVGLIQCESNLLGIRNKAGAGVGSGGW